MLNFKLVQVEIVNGNVTKEEILQSYTKKYSNYISSNKKIQSKKFLERLKDLDIESETDDIPYVWSLTKSELEISQDIYYGENDDGEEVTIQVKLTINKDNDSSAS